MNWEAIIVALACYAVGSIIGRIIGYAVKAVTAEKGRYTKQQLDNAGYKGWHEGYKAGEQCGYRRGCSDGYATGHERGVIDAKEPNNEF